MNLQLHNHALDAIYKAMERLNSTVPALADSSNNTDEIADGSARAIGNSVCAHSAVDSFQLEPQRTPEQREAYLRAEIVKDRERKGYE